MGIFLSWSTLIAVVITFIGPIWAVNFDACLAEVQSGAFGAIGGRDNHGRPVSNISIATSISYDLCISACGSGQADFEWSPFAQQFTSWLLPWWALLSHLPFGANDKWENLHSLLLTVGSPTLAAYSLALTALNGRWLTRRFSSYRYPNVSYAVRLLNSLQQTPLQVTDDRVLLASLIVLPQNDKWWKELVEHLHYTHTWSIAAVANVLWVTIAYVFALIDLFTGTISHSFNVGGQAIGSLWLWLLPIVVGWLQISPKCNSIKITDAMKYANSNAYVATKDEPAPASSFSEDYAISVDFNAIDEVRHDEICPSPIYNYARLFSWTKSVEVVAYAFRAASDRSYDHQPVNPDNVWKSVPKFDDSEPSESCRIGTKSQVERYCSGETEQVSTHWSSEVLSRMLIASIMALVLQWGTTGAAIVVVYFTPTIGLSCQSGSYLLYGAVSTIVWFLLVTSSILTHYSATEPRNYQGSRRTNSSYVVAKNLSIIFRRLGKVLADLNAFWIMFVSVIQFGNFFDRCYCSSCRLSLGKYAYSVLQLVDNDVPGMKHAWTGGVSMASAACIVFMTYVYLLINPGP